MKRNGRPANGLLQSLSADDFELVRPHLHPHELAQRSVLHDPGQQIENVCFVDSGMISLVTIMRRGTTTETAVIGLEGMSGLALFHHMTSAPERAIVQAAGAGHVVSAASFTELVAACATLRFQLHRFAFALSSFSAQTSACNRRHSADQRLARWLLLAQDRVNSTTLPLTHEFVAQMLGVRRSTVTVIAEALRDADIIDYWRGTVEVLDRDALEEKSCECYSVIRDVYESALAANTVT